MLLFWFLLSSHFRNYLIGWISHVAVLCAVGRWHCSRRQGLRRECIAAWREKNCQHLESLQQCSLKIVDIGHRVLQPDIKWKHVWHVVKWHRRLNITKLLRATNPSVCHNWEQIFLLHFIVVVTLLRQLNLTRTTNFWAEVEKFSFAPQTLMWLIGNVMWRERN